MDNTVWKLRLIDYWRVRENECRFEDMAARGLHLEKLGSRFEYFEHGEPERVYYRVDYAYDKCGDAGKRKERFTENGWKYVCENRGMRVYRKPEASAAKFYSDFGEQAAVLKGLSRRLMRGTAIGAVFFLAFICALGAVFEFTQIPLLLPELDKGSINILVLAVLIIFSFINMISRIRSIRLLRCSVRDGCAVVSRVDWRNRRLFAGIEYALVLMLCVANFIIPFFASSLRHAENLPPNNDGRILCLADIENDPALERRTFALHNGVDWGNSIEYKLSPFAETYLFRERGRVPGRTWSGGGTYEPGLYCEVYDLRVSWLAGVFLRDLCGMRGKYNMTNDTFPVTETMVPGYDRLFTGSDGDSKKLVARKGNTIVYIMYYGERDMNALIEAVNFET